MVCARWIPKNSKKKSLIGRIDPLNIAKTSPLPWNKFRYISKDPKDWYLNVVVTVTTRALTIPEISADRRFRLTQIYELHRFGLNDHEIANFLNTLTIKPPRTKAYTGKLVWGARKKYEARLKRAADTSLIVERVLPVIVLT